MKISPIATGGNPGTNLSSSQERTASPEKMALAKAIAAGESQIRISEADLPEEEEVSKAKKNVRRLQMKTNASTNRFDAKLEELKAEEVKEETTESAISDEIEQTEVASEDTKPLSPQFAALAKERRAIQKERAQLAAERAALESNADLSAYVSKADIQAKPLRVLQEMGVTYEQLTQAILSDQSNTVDPEVLKLRDEVKALKEGFDKTLVDRDEQAEQQVLSEMKKEAEALVRDGDTFEMVRETRSMPDVMRLIHQTYKQTGEVLEVQEALQLVEDELINESLKIANIGKVKSKILPPQASEQEQTQRTLKTLTNRDSASVGLSRRERAIMAANGTLRKG